MSIVWSSNKNANLVEQINKLNAWGRRTSNKIALI